jgi:hypothetical protein
MTTVVESGDVTCRPVVALYGAIGALPQAASVPTIRTTSTHTRKRFMTVLLLEALGAGLIFVGIIWWTMFAGRSSGELKDCDPEHPKISDK